eukprot:2854618-Prymnesium_polylepis.1
MGDLARAQQVGHPWARARHLRQQGAARRRGPQGGRAHTVARAGRRGQDTAAAPAAAGQVEDDAHPVGLRLLHPH